MARHCQLRPVDQSRGEVCIAQNLRAGTLAGVLGLGYGTSTPMRRSPAAGAGRMPAMLLPVLTLAASLVGCRPDVPLAPHGVRQLAIVLFTDTLRPGALVQALAFPLNADGDIVDAPVNWQSLTPTKLLVDQGGSIRALAPGVGVIRASVGSVIAERSIHLVNPPVASLVTSADSLLLELPGSVTQLTIEPFDADGVPIVGVSPLWQSDASRIAGVNGAGVVTPVAVGRTTLRVTVDGVTKRIPVRVVPVASATAPTLSSVTPAVIVPGVAFALRGTQLKPAGNGTAILVDGRPTQLLSVSDTLVTAVLSASGQSCEPSSNIAVQVSTSGGVAAIAARLELAPLRQPAVGEALILTGAADPRCLELPGDGEYLVSVINTSRALGAGTASLSLAGLAGVGEPVTIVAPQLPALPSAMSAHLRTLEASRRAVATAPIRSRVMAELQVAPVGELSALRVPNLDAANSCASFRPIHARTVYAGTRVFIVEDSSSQLGATPLLTRTMDVELQELGTEIDNVIWPIISQFGDPLVMDNRLDDNDRIVIAITPELHTMLGGAILGAVVSCDFYARSQFASSNVGEIMYLQAPRLREGEDAAAALARWRHAVRGTIAHELKHVVSFAEHIVRNLPLEEVWLEEATAQHAEELFTRVLTGASPTGDTPYETIRCEILSTQGDGGCLDTPALMRPTLDALWDFLVSPSTRSPLGPASAGDFSFYGSGWSLLRWAIDHGPLSEAAFTQQLTVSTQSGVANLEARAGRSWDEMLARWSLAVATDGRSGFAGADPTLRLPSWNVGSLFAGLCGDLGPCSGGVTSGARYTRADPVQPIQAPLEFALDIPDLVPGGFQLVRVPATGLGTRRFLRLSTASGAPLPNTARLAILRIN